MTEDGKQFLAAFDREAHRWHHFSVSLLKAFQECERLPYFRYVLGIKPPQTKAKKRGSGAHAQQERYLTSGQDVFEDRMQPVKAHLPAPGSDLLIEFGFDLKPKVEGVPFDHAKSVVQLAGLPFEGYVDALDPRDPIVAWLYDLKTTKPGRDDPFQYVLTEDELLEDIQYLGYAGFVHEAKSIFPRVQEIAARWIYAFYEGPIAAKAVTIRESLDDAYARWLTVNQLALRVRQLEQVKSEDDIPATGKYRGECENHYGKPCPYRSRCFKSPSAVLQSVVRGHFLRNGNRAQASKQLSRGEQEMSLQARLRQQPATQTITPTPTVDEDAAKLAAMIPAGGSVQTTPSGKRLVFDAAGELVGTLPPKPAPVATPKAPEPAPVTPPAAPAPDGTCPFMDGDRRCILPPNHPGSIHDFAPPSAPAVSPTPSAGSPATGATPGAVSIVPPDAPASNALAQPASNALVQPEEKKRAKRPPPLSTQANNSPAPEVQGAASAQVAPTVPATPVRPDTSGGETKSGPGRIKGLKLCVNCVPFREHWEPLNDYARKIASEVEKAMQVEDFRLAEVGAVKGRGGIAALVRQEPPPAKAYVAWLGAYDGELATVVEALEPLCEDLHKGK